MSCSYVTEEFDFDSIGLDDTKDRARQNIIKKRYFPKNIIGYTKKAERVNFAKKGSEDKIEIVFRFLFCLISKSRK